MTVSELAELSKFSKAYISQVKNGKRPPSDKLIKVLEQSLEHDTKSLSKQYTALNLFLKSRREGISPNTIRDYRITPDMSLNVNKKIDEYVNDIRKLEKNRFECAKKLFKKDWDFFFLLFSGTDWIQHVMYDKLISGTISDSSDPIKAYEEIDVYIRWFIENLPKETDILFMFFLFLF